MRPLKMTKKRRAKVAQKEKPYADLKTIQACGFMLSPKICSRSRSMSMSNFVNVMSLKMSRSMSLSPQGKEAVFKHSCRGHGLLYTKTTAFHTGGRTKCQVRT